MSTPKKQSEITTNQRLLNRLYRLPIVTACNVSTIIAYLGLLLVNKGNSIPFPKALKIVKKAKLDLKIESNSAIPCINILDALIHLVIYKRELLEFFFLDEELPVWTDETSGPLFDIMKEINVIYKV